MPRGAPPMTLEALQSFYAGCFFSTVALKSRLAGLGQDGRAAVEEVNRYQRTIADYRAAINETRDMTVGGDTGSRDMGRTE